MVSKTIGEGEKEKANEYFSMLNYFLIIVGFILTILGLIFIRPISILLGAEGEILKHCVTYGRVLIVALIPFILQNSFQAFFVVAEKPQLGLIISIIKAYFENNGGTCEEIKSRKSFYDLKIRI